MVSTVISIVAIIISVIAIIMEIKGRRTTIETSFFSKHFETMLYKSIPEKRNKLSFKDEELQNIEPLLEDLALMRKRCRLLQIC